MLLNDYIILDFNFCVYFIVCENKDLRVFYFEINFQKYAFNEQYQTKSCNVFCYFIIDN